MWFDFNQTSKKNGPQLVYRFFHKTTYGSVFLQDGLVASMLYKQEILLSKKTGLASDADFRQALNEVRWKTSVMSKIYFQKF